MNPAREVKTERFSRTEGKTLAFVEGEVQSLLEAVETSTHTGLRDRALLGVLAYTFARIGAVVNLKVEDYYPSGKRFLLRFNEKGGKEKELPVHHKLEELLDQYLKATGLEREPDSPLLSSPIAATMSDENGEACSQTGSLAWRHQERAEMMTVGSDGGATSFFHADRAYQDSLETVN